VHLSTGEVAPDSMLRNVSSTKERGQEAKREFLERFSKSKQDYTATRTKTESPASEKSDFTTQDTSSTPEKGRSKYTDPIKWQEVISFDKLKRKIPKVSVVEDEGKSFAAILTEYDRKQLNLRSIMEWPITSKPWAICNEQGTSRASSKSLFRNNLQKLSPQPAMSKPPEDIECCVVDAMRVVRIIPITGLEPQTFFSWAVRIVNYLKSLPGNTLHLVFDDYRAVPGQTYLSKGRPNKGRERRISDLSQQLPKTGYWNGFLTNDRNKLQLSNLLADFIMSGKSSIQKDTFVTKGEQCLFLASDSSSPSTQIEELRSSHREADPRIAHHAVFAAKKHRETCVVADDTDVYVLLLFCAEQCEGNVYFQQGTSSSREGITYHNIKSLASHLGKDVCGALLAFHALTWSDYTQPFYGRSKFKSFEKMRQNPESIRLLSSLSTQTADVDQVADFVLHTIYNQPKKERTPGESRYSMLISGKGHTRKFTSSKRLPPDSNSLGFHIKRDNFVIYGMVNCLTGSFEQPDPLNYGWKFEDGVLVPIWYEGDSVPQTDQLQNKPAPQVLDFTNEHCNKETVNLQPCENEVHEEGDIATDEESDVAESDCSSEDEDEFPE